MLAGVDPNNPPLCVAGVGKVKPAEEAGAPSGNPVAVVVAPPKFKLVAAEVVPPKPGVAPKLNPVGAEVVTVPKLNPVFGAEAAGAPPKVKPVGAEVTVPKFKPVFAAEMGAFPNVKPVGAEVTVPKLKPVLGAATDVLPNVRPVGAQVAAAKPKPEAETGVPYPIGFAAEAVDVVLKLSNGVAADAGAPNKLVCGVELVN